MDISQYKRYDSMIRRLKIAIEASTGGDRDILITNLEILEDMPVDQRIGTLKLFEMLSRIHGMSSVLAWGTTCRIARVLASGI